MIVGHSTYCGPQQWSSKLYSVMGMLTKTPSDDAKRERERRPVWSTPEKLWGLVFSRAFVFLFTIISSLECNILIHD